MLLPIITEYLARVGRQPAVEAALGELRRGTSQAAIAGPTAPVKALLAAIAATELRRPVVLLTDTARSAEQLLEPLQFFLRAVGGAASGSAVLLPAFDRLPGEGVGPHPDILEKRAAALWRYVTGQASVLVAPVAASLFSFSEPDAYSELSQSLSVDEEIPLDDVVSALVRAGYVRTELVETSGEFAVRGGILDVFPAQAERPVRVELLGDTIESLREFDAETQRSIGPLHRLTLVPMSEFPAQDHKAGRNGSGIEDFEDAEPESAEPASARTLFNLRDDALVIVDEPEAIDKAVADWRTRHEEDSVADSDGLSTALLTDEQWSAAMAAQQRLSLEHLSVREGRDQSPQLTIQPTTRYHGQIPAFLAEIRSRLANRQHVLVAAANFGELERLADLCREYEVPYTIGEIDTGGANARLTEEGSSATGSAVVLVRAAITEGFVIPSAGLVFYGSADLFETLPAAERQRSRSKTAGFISDLSELKPGSYVVHVDHGIGQFEGLQPLETDARRGEFMRLRYADGAHLYVPLERMDLVQAYRSLDEAKPTLDRLGGTAWTGRKSRVKKALTDLADKLLALYAERKSAPGFAFGADSTWQKEFEDAFEFTETPDQLAAIEEIRKDMESTTPMDRLLCGDVGYGKTEVAMRAAFKAVADGKQVAVLAPTTVLVFQHYETFRRRMGAFPVRIDMLSRVRTPREQKKTLADLAAGKIDILIGTQRILSKDVVFHDLGLLVVDEEQRFGVTHKERLKELSRNVDALTMSATPIPRTLNMSLVGLRDMSLIETPPKDRLAIQTVVAPFSESLLKRAISDEMERGGQVFFVHNRVESIYSIAHLIQKLVPKARVVVGHGQMTESQLEKVMLAFVRDEADVLVSTTIVENGLDIPRANTILINRADRLGLSELYQLRGRVGRSNQRAYAYLLVPPEELVTPLAKKRLAALREFSDLGAGFRIAALDLELRGAGNLLGREQHGQISAIGFDLYCQMMERAVAARKGRSVDSDLRTTLNLGVDIRIPPDYIPVESMRLQTYKKIAGVSSEEEGQRIRQELGDRFGTPPRAVDNLIAYSLLKSLCERLQISSVERRGGQVSVKFYPTTPVPPGRLVEVVGKRKGLSLDPHGVLTLALAPGAEKIAESIRNVLQPLESGG